MYWPIGIIWILIGIFLAEEVRKYRIRHNDKFDVGEYLLVILLWPVIGYILLIIFHPVAVSLILE